MIQIVLESLSEGNINLNRKSETPGNFGCRKVVGKK